MTYRNAPTKEVKRNMEELIIKIKSQFETEVARNDRRFQKLNRLKGELAALTDQGMLFDKSKKEIKNNKIYENAFEWRFEFPEVLNDDGDFVGFDVVIGNPPYITKLLKQETNYFQNYYDTIQGRKTVGKARLRRPKEGERAGEPCN
jgi:adenine-specific DNA-methyltransferase